LAITLDDIILSVIAAFIGLAVTLPVTYLVVDRLIERNEKKELEPVVRTARERLTSKLGVGFLTTFLITIAIDVTSALEEKRPIPKELLESYNLKLKMAQSELEMLLGLYNRVLTVQTEHLTGSIISALEHLQEDFQYLAETFPKPPRAIHVRHIENVILQTVKLTKEELQLLGADNEQVLALEEWLMGFAKRRAASPVPEEPIELSGKHSVV
jgi:hypothetical protein